jgi:hypothetical protein
MTEDDVKKNATQSFAKSTREQAQEQAEASFEGFMSWTKYVTYASIGFLLVVGACNFGVEDDSFPAYNGEYYSPSNLNTKS